MSELVGLPRLFDDFRRVPYRRPARRTTASRGLPVLILIGPPGSGKTHLLKEDLAHIARHRPNAYYAVTEAGDVRPREIAGRLAAGLFGEVKGLRRLRFHRLLVGLVALQAGPLSVNPALAEQELRAALLGPRNPNPVSADLAPVVDVFRVFAPGIPGLDVLSNLMQNPPRLPLRLAKWPALQWYGRQRPPLTELRNLHTLSLSPDANDQAYVDKVLCSAFLDDLRAAYPRPYDGMRCVAFIDGIDNPDNLGGRRFAQLLVKLRAQDRTISDPLLVIGTASNIATTPGPAGRAVSTRQIEWADQVTFTDWVPIRDRPLDSTSWDWFYVRLRGLRPEAIKKMSLDLAADMPAAHDLARNLTRGHAEGARLLLDALTAGANTGRDQSEILRGVLQVRSADPNIVPVPTGATIEAALNPLLRGFSDEQKPALTLWAAARDLDTAQNAGLLPTFTLAMQTGLVDALQDRLWLVEPDPPSARTRGGVAEDDEAGNSPDPAGVGLVIHPWLRLLLLARLAHPRSGDPSLPEEFKDWDLVHTHLRDTATTAGRTQDVYYHALALGELGVVVDHLLDELPPAGMPVEAWLHDLYLITAAPLRDPATGNVPAETRARSLAERVEPDTRSPRGWLATLVACLWLATDARNRLPDQTNSDARELNRLIHDAFDELSRASEAGSPARVSLRNEAKKYA
ncbi:hypothetical protein ABZT48_36965 [Streptomyces avermitilis]|uniref:hypothetical protein n=1 Tax=Streptomyces avermitilis TaxID=33903 RepID=UPI0033BC9F21